MGTLMNDKPATSIRIACGVCRHEVPVSEAISPEASDYVVHFCGVECYQRWLNSSHTPGDDTF